MIRNSTDRPPIMKGTGYANLTDESSYSGMIYVYDEWVAIETDHARYTLPRERIHFINWKEVE